VVVAVGTLSLAVSAAQRGGGQGNPFGGPPSADAIQVEALAANLYVLRGGGGNTAAFIRSDGVVLVDTKLTGWGQPIIEKLRTLTDKPVTTIINTHTHFDHVNGNVEFPATVEIVAHENTKRLMEEWNPVFGLDLDNPNPFEASKGRGMPTRTFSDQLSLGAGADRVDLYHYGPAHTGGDTWVVFPSARVMHAGDAFPSKGAPIMDKNNGGSGVRYSDTLTRAAQTPDVDQVITGHSAVMSMAELAEYAAFIGDLVSAAQQSKRDGRSPEDFANNWTVPARYSGYTQPPANSLRSNADVIFEQTN
jgi:glyoxylase-like metal-dependent hydrolase (beta-lactamase superfamily II)